ncbi:MAG: hypothetical protein K1X29_04170 [Bdellovibrionales bacterium]|nr:hypothetical protein [Bdellovibrionales bacterium]
MIRFIVFCQIVSFFLFTSAQVHGSVRCREFVATRSDDETALTSAPTFFSTKRSQTRVTAEVRGSDLQVKIGRETLTIPGGGDPYPKINLNPIFINESSKVITVDTGQRQFFLSTASRIRDTKFEPCTGVLHLIVHPKVGLIVVDSSGFVLPLPIEIISLQPDQIENFFVFNNDFNETVAILVRKDGIAFRLNFKPTYKVWGSLTTNRMIVIEGSTSQHLDAYTFFHVSQLDFVMFSQSRDNASQGTYAEQRTRAYDFLDTIQIGQDFVFSDRGIVAIRLFGEGKVLLALKGNFAVIDFKKREVAFKCLEFCMDHYSVDLGVDAMIDMKPQGLDKVAVILSTGSVRMIDRSMLLGQGSLIDYVVDPKTGKPMGWRIPEEFVGEPILDATVTTGREGSYITVQFVTSGSDVTSGSGVGKNVTTIDLPLEGGH